MFRRKGGEHDFDAEIEAHIRLESRRLEEHGLSEEEACMAARRAFAADGKRWSHNDAAMRVE